MGKKLSADVHFLTYCQSPLLPFNLFKSSSHYSESVMLSFQNALGALHKKKVDAGKSPVGAGDTHGGEDTVATLPLPLCTSPKESRKGLQPPPPLVPGDVSMSNSKASDSNMMLDELPDNAAPNMESDSEPEIDPNEVLRHQRDQQRNLGNNVSKFHFVKRNDECSDQTLRPNPLNPQNFTPRTNATKPRPTRASPRVVRYFREVHAEPATPAALEKTMHKLLIMKPTYASPRCTNPPPGFAPTSAGPAGQVVESPAGSMSPIVAKASQPSTVMNLSPRALVSPGGSPTVRPSQSRGAGNVFITEAGEMASSQCHVSMIRDQSFASSTRHSPVMGSKKNSKFSMALATKLKRKATRRKTVHDLQQQLDQVESFGLPGAEDDDFLDLPEENDDQTSGGEGTGGDDGNMRDSTVSDSVKRRSTRRQTTHARSLFSTLLPEVTEERSLKVKEYPKKLSVELMLEKVLRAEPPQIIARIGPAVESFLKGEDCKKMLLGLFWHSVVIMQKAKLEAELLRAHKSFEHAFYEVNPRSNIHPTIEQAEQALRSAPLANLGATLDMSAMDPYAFSGYFASGASLRSPSLTGNLEATTSISCEDDGGSDRFTADIRHDALRAALDDLIVAQGELEDAVLFEEAAFHSMAIHFGKAFRSTTGGGGNDATNSGPIGDGGAKPTPSHDLYPFERKEAIFSVFPTIAAHTTFYVLVKVFPNDAHAHIFNKAFRRDLLRRFSFWCSGVTMQHIATRNWPTPVEEDAAETTNVLISKENVVNGQYAVMKEFHRRAHHSSHVFQEWLTALGDKDASMLIDTPSKGGGALAAGASTTLPPIQQSLGAVPSQELVPTSTRSRMVSGSGTRHQQSRGRNMAPTLQSAATLWYSFGAARGQLTSERKFEYGCAGVAVEGDHGVQVRNDQLKMAGALFSRVPLPIPDVAGGLHSGTATQHAVVPATSPFMRHYAQAALSVELKVVDLAGREAPPLQFTQLSALDKFSVHLRFGLHAQHSQANADSAVEENKLARTQQDRLARKLQQENEHFKRVEELKLQYANRLINFHLSPRNPECIKDALHCERLLRDALSAPSILTAQSTLLCQQALRSYRQVMFQPSDRRQVLHELSIRVACRIRQLQRLRGDVWGSNENASTLRRHGSTTNMKGRTLSPVSSDIDVANTDFDQVVSVNEFPLVGEPLDLVASKIVLHEHGHVAQNVRLDEELTFSDMMSAFVKIHKRIFTRDRSRYPLMRPAFLPFAVKDDGPDVSAEDRWRGQVIAGNSVAMDATKLFARGQVATYDAAQKLKGLASFDAASSPQSNVFIAAKRRDEQMHVEQLRQRLATEAQVSHDELHNELDKFVAATAIGRRGRLMTPPNAVEGEGVRFEDAARMLNNTLLSSRQEAPQRHSLDGIPLPPALQQLHSLERPSPAQTPMSPQTILQRVNLRTPQAPQPPAIRSGRVARHHLPHMATSPSTARAASFDVVSPQLSQHSVASAGHNWAAVTPPRQSELIARCEPSNTLAMENSGELSCSSPNASVDHRGDSLVPDVPHPRHRVRLVNGGR